jgi:hypothetical protein
LSDFRATVSLIQKGIKYKEGDREITRDIAGVPTNIRNLEVIKLFDKGFCKVSSVSEVPKLTNSGVRAFAYKVDFNSQSDEDIQSIIEKFNDVFIVKSISEVSKN